MTENESNPDAGDSHGDAGEVAGDGESLGYFAKRDREWAEDNAEGLERFKRFVWGRAERGSGAKPDACFIGDEDYAELCREVKETGRLFGLERVKPYRGPSAPKPIIPNTLMELLDIMDTEEETALGKGDQHRLESIRRQRQRMLRVLSRDLEEGLTAGGSKV